MNKETKRDPDVGGFELEDQGSVMKPMAEMTLTPMQKAWAALMTVIAIVALILAIVACTKTYTNDDYALKTEVVSAATISSDSTVMKNINDITALQADITALEQGKASKEDLSSAVAKQGGIFLQTTDHGFPEAAFWIPVRDGYNDAAMAVGVTQDFQPGLGNLDTMKAAITNAGKTQVDGLVVSIWNTNLIDSIKVAIDNNVPVISINSGIDSFQSAGIQVHIGQDETLAGKQVAISMIEDLNQNTNIPVDFKWKALCVNHEGRRNVGTTQRCDAFEAEMRAAGHEVYSWHMVDTFDFTDAEGMADYQNRIKEYVNEGYDAILTSTNDIAVLTYGAVEDAGKKDEVDISTFDIDPIVLRGLKEGHLDFAVDQQAYLQGFLPIVLLSLKVRYELMLTQGPLLTGPYIVTGSEDDTKKYATRDYKDPSTALKQPEDIRIAVVTHGRIEAGFWQVVQNGVKSAARDFGIAVEYRHPTEKTDFNDDRTITAMTELVDEYVQSGEKIDGLVISILDCGETPGSQGAAFKAKIKEATELFPVISINSGGDCYTSFGGALSSQKIKAHVGADETSAGKTVGDWMGLQSELQNKKVLCISHEPANAALITRCDGIRDALKAAWGADYNGYNYFALTIGPSTTESDKRQQIKDKVIELGMAEEDVMITHGPMTAETAKTASEQMANGPKVGTFDLSFAILESMAVGGKGLFCVDQQQFMQGYLPVMFHYLNARWGNGLPQQFVKTGPAMITDHTMATHLLRLVEDKIR